jgi:hypothetical protein
MLLVDLYQLVGFSLHLSFLSRPRGSNSHSILINPLEYSRLLCLRLILGLRVILSSISLPKFCISLLHLNTEK